jgi:hypothetical protein
MNSDRSDRIAEQLVEDEQRAVRGVLEHVNPPTQPAARLESEPGSVEISPEDREHGLADATDAARSNIC